MLKIELLLSCHPEMILLFIGYSLFVDLCFSFRCRKTNKSRQAGALTVSDPELPRNELSCFLTIFQSLFSSHKKVTTDLLHCTACKFGKEKS